MLRKLASKNLKSIRLAKQMSQRDLAKRTGLHVQYISLLETNAHNMTLDLVEKLAKGLGVGTSKLLCDVKERSSGDTNELDSAIQLLTQAKNKILSR